MKNNYKKINREVYNRLIQRGYLTEADVKLLERATALNYAVTMQQHPLLTPSSEFQIEITITKTVGTTTPDI